MWHKFVALGSEGLNEILRSGVCEHIGIGNGIKPNLMRRNDLHIGVSAAQPTHDVLIEVRIGEQARRMRTEWRN